MDEFQRMQQDVIDDDMRTMPPGMVKEILADMKPAEADAFLGRLGHVRAADIYEAEEEEGCLLLSGLLGSITLLLSLLWYWVSGWVTC